MTPMKPLHRKLAYAALSFAWFAAYFFLEKSGLGSTAIFGVVTLAFAMGYLGIRNKY